MYKTKRLGFKFQTDRNMALKILILHSLDDIPEVKSFLQQIKEILCDCRVDVILFDDDKNLGELDEIVKDVHVVFVFMTETFCTRDWKRYSSAACVRTMLVRDGPATLVPIFTVKRSQATFTVPLGLNCLQGLRYCDQDQFYRNSVRQTLTGIIEENQLGSVSWFPIFNDSLNDISYVMFNYVELVGASWRTLNFLFVRVNWNVVFCEEKTNILRTRLFGMFYFHRVPSTGCVV